MMEFVAFRVTNYRNILDSGRIAVNRITSFVGQNEAGKSNLFDALYRVNPFDQKAAYNLSEANDILLRFTRDLRLTCCYLFSQPYLDQ